MYFFISYNQGKNPNFVVTYCSLFVRNVGIHQVTNSYLYSLSLVHSEMLCSHLTCNVFGKHQFIYFDQFDI